MIIEKIDIKSFGRITDLVLEFSESINVIEGANEAGKTTIAAFIKYMLFGFDAVENESVLGERKKRINWSTGLAQGSMVVRVGDKRYLVTRSTVPTEGQNNRPTYKEESAIIDMESGATAFGKIPAGEVFFGVSRSLFENTAFLGQIGNSAIDEDSVKESIENILFSANAAMNNRRAMASIADKMEGLMHRGGHGGVIHDLIRKQEELEGDLVRYNEQTKDILFKESELYRIRHERADAEDKIEKLYDLDSCYKNVMLIQTFDKLHELEEECAAKTEAYNKFIEENTRGGYVPPESYLTDIAVARRVVNDTYRDLREAEECYDREKNAIGITKEIESTIEVSDTLGGEEQVRADAHARRGSFFKSIGIGIGCGLAFIASLVAAIVINLLPSWIICGIIAAGALGAGAFFLRSALASRKKLGSLAAAFGVSTYEDLLGKVELVEEARAKRDSMIKSTEAARVALEKARENYERAKTDLTEVILRWGEEPPASELNAFLDALEAKVSEFLNKKRMLLEEKNTIELTVREIRQTLSDKNEIDIRAQVSPLKRKALSVINHDDIITGIAAYRAKIQEQDKLAYTVENELIALKSDGGDPSDCYSKIKSLEARIGELRARHKAYFIAHKAIESASDNLRAGISPRLGEYATGLMSIMTDKKYTDFSVADGLKVEYTDEEGVHRTVDFLSGGTRDLAYIAVRIALVDMLYGNECPPLCFDESFAHQDNNRARAMMKALAHLSGEGYQSFIFTCRAREATLARELDKSAGVFKLSVSEDDIA
ncbi:MAG: AAA family ATPase [Clostridia bacterium]|nr:AAA family ATPase [Clostridia bacterium]